MKGKLICVLLSLFVIFSLVINLNLLSALEVEADFVVINYERLTVNDDNSIITNTSSYYIDKQILKSMTTRSAVSENKVMDESWGIVKITCYYDQISVGGLDHMKLTKAVYLYDSKSSRYSFESVVARTRNIGYGNGYGFSSFSEDKNLGNLNLSGTYTKNVSSSYVADSAVSAGLVGAQTTFKVYDKVSRYYIVNDGLLIKSVVQTQNMIF